MEKNKCCDCNGRMKLGLLLKEATQKGDKIKEFYECSSCGMKMLKLLFLTHDESKSFIETRKGDIDK